MQSDEQQLERLLSALDRLSEAIETVAEMMAIGQSQSGDEEESGLNEPQAL